MIFWEVLSNECMHIHPVRCWPFCCQLKIHAETLCLGGGLVRHSFLYKLLQVQMVYFEKLIKLYLQLSS